MALDREDRAEDERYADVPGPRPPAVRRKQEERAARLTKLAERIVWLPAGSIKGVRAKAAVMATYLGEGLDGEPDSDYEFERLARSLALDLRDID